MEEQLTQMQAISASQPAQSLFTADFEEEKARWATTFQETLSALRQNNIDLKQELNASTAHPYTKTINQYWPEGIPTFKFADLKIFDKYDHAEVTKMLDAIDEEILQDTYNRLEFLEKSPDPEKHTNCVVFCADRVGDTYIINEEKMRNHLKFINFLKELDLEGLTAEPVKAVQKMLTLYVQTYANFFPRTKKLLQEFLLRAA